MRTIIPFPQIHSASPTSSSGRRLSRSFNKFSRNQVLTVQSQVDLPEGESMSAAIRQMPRARAIHDEITSLIAEVRGRFG